MLYFIGQEKSDWPESVKKHLPYFDGTTLKEKAHPEGIAYSLHAGTLFELAMFSNPKNIIEVGRRAGESTRMLLDVCLIKQSHLWSIDSNKECEDLYVSLDKKYHPYYHQLFGDGCNYEWPYKAEFIFIDTNHTYHETLREVNSLWKYLNDPGIMVVYKTDSHWGAKKAVFEWAEEKNIGLIFDSRAQGMAIFMKPEYPQNSLRDRKDRDYLKNDSYRNL